MGSMRDALSIADICVSYKETKLTYNDVLEILGATDSSKITELIDNILHSSTGSALETVESLTESGKSVGVLCKDIISRLREVVLCKTCKSAQKILELPDDVYASIEKVAGVADEHRLLRTIEIFSEAEGAMRYSVSPKIILECACIKSSEPEADYNIDALMSRISALEKALAEGGFARGNGGESTPKIVPLKGEAKVSAQGVPTREASASKTEKNNSSSDFDYGYDDIPVPPPEDDFGGGYIEKPAYKSINEQKPTQTQTVTIRETAPVSPAATAETPAIGEGVSAGKIWGTVVRKLRAEKQIVLWIACQEMTAKLYGKTLKVTANDDAGFNAVTKSSNLEILSKIVKSVGDYDIEILKPVDAAEQKSQFEKDVDEVKKTFGEKYVKLED